MTDSVFQSTGTEGTKNFKAVERAAGEWVFREESLGTEMYIVQDGQVEILKQVGDGEEDLHQLSVLERGDFFGEMALLEHLPRAAGARALTDVRLLEINGSTFIKMLRDNPEIAVRMMRKLSRRLRETDALLRELGAGRMPVGPPSPPSERADETADESAHEKLVHGKSGMEFALAKGAETTVGRKDAVTGIYPDVDLAPLDSQRSISRRHAKIFRKSGKYFLSEEIGTMNGTFVNGERLETGVPIEIHPGDRLRFGVIDLDLVAETGD